MPENAREWPDSHNVQRSGHDREPPPPAAPGRRPRARRGRRLRARAPPPVLPRQRPRPAVAGGTRRRDPGPSGLRRRALHRRRRTGAHLRGLRRPADPREHRARHRRHRGRPGARRHRRRAVRRAARRGAHPARHGPGLGALALDLHRRVGARGAGLLDGRTATTHWAHAASFRGTSPTCSSTRTCSGVDDGDVLTSAGNAAGIDLLLHVLRTDHGTEVANRVARGANVASVALGGQAQFIERPFPAGQPGPDGTGARRAWASERLDESLDLATLAAHARMSVRTFTRRFRDETGSQPGAVAHPSRRRPRQAPPGDAPTCRSTRWRPGRASARAPRCAGSSRPRSGCRRWPTVAPARRIGACSRRARGVVRRGHRRAVLGALRQDQRRARHRVGDDGARQAEDLLDELGGDDLGGRALGDDRAVLHRDEVGGVAGGLVEVVQHRDERRALLGAARRTGRAARSGARCRGRSSARRAAGSASPARAPSPTQTRCRWPPESSSTGRPASVGDAGRAPSPSRTACSSSRRPLRGAASGAGSGRARRGRRR